MEGFFGKEKTEQIRELWESGREVPKHLIVKDEEPQAEEGGRGDRGGRGGRGRGRGGKRDRNGRGGSSKKDPRHVVTEVSCGYRDEPVGLRKCASLII